MKINYYTSVFALIIFLAACSAPDKNRTAEQQKPEPIKSKENLFTDSIGVQTYSFRNSFPNGIEATLDTIAEMGITLIEGGPLELEPEQFVKLCNDRGMRVVSTGADFGELRDDPETVAERAKRMGVNYVMCAWVPHKGGQFNKENADLAISVFENAGKVLKEAGITLCYHFHGYEFQPYENATLTEYMIENSNPDYLAFEMDIMWIHFGGGDPALLLRQYPNRWKLMHIKDLKIGTPKNLTGGTDTDNDVAVGTGELDIPEIMKAAKEVGVEYYFIEDESSRVTQQVPQSIAYLRSL